MHILSDAILFGDVDGDNLLIIQYFTCNVAMQKTKLHNYSITGLYYTVATLADCQ